MQMGRVVAAAVAGVVGGAVVAAAVTELLSTLVWPSLLVGLPMGGVVGVATGVLAYFYSHPEEMNRIEQSRETLHADLKADPDVVASADDLPASDT